MGKAKRRRELDLNYGKGINLHPVEIEREKFIETLTNSGASAKDLKFLSELLDWAFNKSKSVVVVLFKDGVYTKALSLTEQPAIFFEDCSATNQTLHNLAKSTKGVMVIDGKVVGLASNN